MRPLSLLLGSVLLSCSLVLPLPAQEVEPYQTLGVAFGWGAVNPTGGTGTAGDAADGGGSIHFGLDTEVRRSPYVSFYARVDADAAEVRQHFGVSGGVRFRPMRRGSIRPLAGLGVGLYWLEPKTDVGYAVDREFPLRMEGHVAAEWFAAPGLRFFLEYRLAGSRFRAVRRGDGPPSGPALTVSDEAVLHLAHSGWFGLRLALF